MFLPNIYSLIFKSLIKSYSKLETRNSHLAIQNSELFTFWPKLQNLNSLDVACYVSTEYLLADYQIINQILLGTRNSYLETRTSKLETLNSSLFDQNSKILTL